VIDIPSLSVVVIPLVGGDTLVSCLDRLASHAGQCIVVLRKDMGGSTEWGRRYPSIIFIDAADQRVPLRRKLGAELATGDIVALVEDTVWTGEGWGAAVRSAFASPQTAGAGGAVIISSRLPPRYQALGWIEYGAFSPKSVRTRQNSVDHQKPITVSRVAGNNMAFRRMELLEALGADHAGLVEDFVCERLRARGLQVIFQARMMATYAACDWHGGSLATRMHHGRIYAATRLESKPWLVRIAYLAKACLLPAALTVRTIGFMAGSGRGNAIAPTLFWLGLMTSAWAIGEGVGVLAGAGKSLQEWH
jgi:hypothetical protein